jgi:hypothetical protein
VLSGRKLKLGDAAAEGKLDPAMLRDSEMRLKRAFPVE